MQQKYNLKQKSLHIHQKVCIVIKMHYSVLAAELQQSSDRGFYFGKSSCCQRSPSCRIIHDSLTVISATYIDPRDC